MKKKKQQQPEVTTSSRHHRREPASKRVGLQMNLSSQPVPFFSKHLHLHCYHSTSHLPSSSPLACCKPTTFKKMWPAPSFMDAQPLSLMQFPGRRYL